MNQGRRSVLGLALLGAVQPVLGAGRGGKAHAALEQELAAIAQDPACELASLSVLAIRNGQVSYEGQFGRRSIGPDRPADAHTLYRIASVSKMMATLGLLRLLEAGKVDLDGDVSRHLGFSLRNPHFPDRIITLRTLLTHTSSLRDDAGYSFGADVALKDMLVSGDVKMWAANAAPGAYFSYCNLGWGVIGTVMEAVTGERFDRLMRRLLLDPLGLQGGYNPSAFAPAELANVATLYRKRTVDTEIWDPSGPWIAQADDVLHKPPAPPPGIERYVIGTNATPFSPTGGLRISARGLGTVMRMLLQGGVHAGSRLLKPATLDQMFSRQWTYDGANGDTLDGFYQAWGLGNQQFPHEPVTHGDLAGHQGDAYGLVSAFLLDRTRRNGMVMLVGGTSTDPFTPANRGAQSAMPRFQERIMTVLQRRAILVRA